MIHSAEDLHTAPRGEERARGEALATGLLPFGVWALQFALSCLITGMVCTDAEAGRPAEDAAGLIRVLGGISLAALAASTALAVHAGRRLRASPRGLLPLTRAAGAAFALLAVLWTAAPLLLLEGMCPAGPQSMPDSSAGPAR
ncbi:hypothetical protein V4F39_03270 [Aquincola sp. MAHUQ-54]|uniref:Uncharacterized protein n=1 Tax=Aquincola agrisoli TaxID=3119538 RepID=A0AAW9QCD6_9BURK